MSESSSRTPDPIPDHHRAPADAAPAPLTTPALTPALPPYAPRLLHDPRIHGQGNRGVRQAALLQVQRTQGNRAARRLLHGAIRAAAPAPAGGAPPGVVIQRMKEAA